MSECSTCVDEPVVVLLVHVRRSHEEREVPDRSVHFVDDVVVRALTEARDQLDLTWRRGGLDIEVDAVRRQECQRWYQAIRGEVSVDPRLHLLDSLIEVGLKYVTSHLPTPVPRPNARRDAR